MQEIIHRAQLTILSLNHPHTTEDRTEPYLAKLVKDLIKDYKQQELDVQEPALFLRSHLNKGLYCGHKDKGYATKVVTTAEKLPLDGFEGQLRRRVEPAG